MIIGASGVLAESIRKRLMRVWGKIEKSRTHQSAAFFLLIIQMGKLPSFCSHGLPECGFFLRIPVSAIQLQ